MNEKLPIEVIPHRSDNPMSVDYNLDKSQSCAADFYRGAIDWEKSALDIKWNW